MKVLFAVNDENVSASIVKKYQKEYKEIISYKNVYYFNAILTELQRNKSYDRIVISEDLEEFTSSSYEQKDKFIFDKLDNISDEAVSNEGKDIPIILICSERRSKSEDILVKLFGISIYNAIIGEDRSIDEVCRLINKPRSKKEAKLYYKIDSENVSYHKGKESDVREEEIQNILMHFKKIGKNETRYVESFNNIASQYNEEQLKVIIAVLPNTVKDVLKMYSPEYQKIVYPNGIPEELKGGKPSSRYTQGKKNKVITSPTGNLLKVENKERMSKPVIVPTTIEENMYQQVTPKKTPELDWNEIEEEKVEEVKPVVENKPKKRGRPRKNPLPEQIEKVEEKPKKQPEPEEIEDADILPGFEDVSDNVLPGFSDEEDRNGIENILNESNNIHNIPSTKDTVDDDYYEENNISNPFMSRQDYNEALEEYQNNFDDSFDNLLMGEKKIAAFVGTSKNGTSFIVNNVAQILSEMNVNTAILDATKNRNSYYIYTKNDEELRKIATNSLKNTINGNPVGIKVNNNLTVYTGIPSQYDEIRNSRPILENIVSNYDVVLIDCDFETPIEYFANAQELYLVQSMDILTIQPLTEFLRGLKIKNALDESKIRIIINKIVRVKGINAKSIIGGMAYYNDPEMAFMTELFNRNTVKEPTAILFDEDVYARYLEGLVECEIKTNGYPKEIKQKLSELARKIYPVSSVSSYDKKNKKGQYTNSFSSGMNNTLNDMRKRI